MLGCRSPRSQYQVAQLKTGLPRDAALATIEESLRELLETHADPQAAEASPAWNRRRRGEYPADYERTLAAHAAWKAEQANVAVDRRIDEALEQAMRIRDRLRDDPEYLAGFAAGVVAVRDDYLGDCPRLIDARHYPKTERGKSSPWNDGYADGQLLAFELEVARLLRDCYVPAAPTP